MLVLGDKYDVPRLREEGLSQLRSCYAKDIYQWGKRSLSLCRDPEARLAIAQVTRTLDDADLHAAVLYDCSWLKPSQLVTGPHALSPDDLVRVFGFMQRLPQLLSDITNGLTGEIPKTCKAHCIQYNDTIRHEASQLLTSRPMSATYLDPFMANMLCTITEGRLCKDCLLRFQSRLHRLRQVQRDRFAEYFSFV